MRQRSKRIIWLKVLMVITIGMLWCSALYAADIQKKLINFQGYLTDNANPPNPLDGTYDLTFRIYERPGDLAPPWTEQHQGVTVIRGNVSVLLGSITEMNLVFDEPAYLGIQVGTDPEMIPRQRLLPAFQAASANKLNVTHADGSKSEFDATRLVPIGLISPFFGDPAALPDNWMICDGSVVNDPESPLHGMTLPDLKAKFIRGEADGAYNILDGLHGGGVDSHTHTALHSHSINNDGDHSHSGTTANGGVDHGHVFSGYTHVSSSPSCGADGNKEGSILACSSHNHYFEGKTGGAGASAVLHTHNFGTSVNGSHNHGGLTGEALSTTGETSHLPSYIALHYIIRIK